MQSQSVETRIKERGSTIVLTCRSCVHFDDDPGHLESEVPGILVFGSAYGSSRGHAGLCSALDRFHDPIPARGCPHFQARFAENREKSSKG